jgi:hypothetical protein
MSGDTKALIWSVVVVAIVFAVNDRVFKFV